MIRTAVFRLWGHDSTGPTGVDDQSKDRIRAAISPPPAKQSCPVPEGPGAFASRIVSPA